MKASSSTSEYKLKVTEPFRLDLTVAVLRRLSINIVDIFTSEGHSIRALDDFCEPVIVRVTQTQPAMLTCTIEGEASDHSQALTIVRRILGVESDISHFHRAARKVPWLWPLATAMKGVKPPRYPTLWEAYVNAILFQLVSLAAASSILRRIVSAIGLTIERDKITFHTFSSVESFMSTSDDLLRTAGLSTSKLATLRRVADAIESKLLNETLLEGLPSPEAAALLRQIKGIGS
ncbi:MAG: hypothetical protein H7249_14080 [Chitinophagaceae bacterium]|nr:hypothetical protein [Oligoflexus sp.]